MSDCSDKKNPLVRNGTSQPERFLPGLKDDFVKIDERSDADIISFGSALSRFLNYFDSKNEISGNWSVFMESDISSVLASLCIQDIEEYKYQIKSRFDFIRDDDHKDNVTSLKRKLYELFSSLATLTYALDKVYPRLEPVPAFQTNFLNIVKNKIGPALKDLIAYYKGAQDEGLLAINNISKWTILNLELKPAEQIFTNSGLSKIWYAESFSSWDDYYNSINADTGIFQYPLIQPGDPQSKIDYEKIYHGINHNLFSGVFDIFLYAYSKIIKDSSTELQATFSTYSEHQPHYALFITFLKLFWEARDSLNSLGKRHLDFYYKEVLNLYNKKAQPDSVHTLIELIKSREDFGLMSGTEFKGGKDSLGNEILYDLASDTVFNKARIASLKSIYLAGSEDNIYDPLTETLTENNQNRLFAAPAINSDDGLGADLQSEFKEWHPIVNRKYKEAALHEISMPKAEIGFAIASHYLYLAEGLRKIYLRLNTNNNNALVGKDLVCFITGPEGWVQLNSPVISASWKKFSDNSTTCVELKFELDQDTPPIVGIDPKIHEEDYNTSLPVLKVYLANQSTSSFQYHALKDLIIHKSEIKVEVGSQYGFAQNGLKNIYVYGVHGVIDPSKPFQPYGARPVAGDKFIVGSPEAFSKNNLRLSTSVEWKKFEGENPDFAFGKLSDGSLPNISVKYLKSGAWETLIEETEIFSPGNGQSTLYVSGEELNQTISKSHEYKNFNIKSKNGFISLELTQSFGHKQYFDYLSLYLISKANETAVPAKEDTSESDPPVEPYTPEVQSIFLSYSAYGVTDFDSTSKSEFDDSEIKLYNLYPFGHKKEHRYLTNKDIFLLPQFKHSINTLTIQHEGEFYIGFEHLKPKQGVNVLFQVLEGSTDPLKIKPEDHIHWSYLSDNTWKNFEKGDVQDSTLNLTSSGIIGFAIPGDATTENTILPAGQVWIRASIEKAADTLCKLLAVETQAALLSFDNHDNAPDFLDSALSAETISKLKNPQAAVKKVLQPYSSFGGRPREDDTHYYIRVSERLRHKDRAVTIWDYEHLVLEAFPEIYRAKCLNHTGIVVKDDNTEVVNEVLPGNVLMITIPQLYNRNDSNPLKPFTNQSTLTKIEDFLKDRISPFVNIKAVQPQFEELRMKFKLKLRPGYNDFEYYAGILRESITRHLTPWAFGQDTEVHFGGTVYKSELIDFIEEQHYVDFIAEVEMYVKVREGEDESNDMEQIDASTARSILVSRPSSKHAILSYD